MVKKPVYQLRDLVAVLPFYEDGCGIASRLWFADGSEVKDARGPKAIMRRALAAQGVDLRAYKKGHGETAYGDQYLPIVQDGLVFMMFKVLHPRVPGDEPFGYVRVQAVERVLERSGYGVLELYGNREVDTVVSAKTAQQYVDRALGDLYRHLHKSKVSQEQFLRAWLSDEPATWCTADALFEENTYSMSALLTVLVALLQRSHVPTRG